MDKEKKIQITLRLPRELKEIIHREAENKGISFNKYVSFIIYKGLQLRQ